MDILVKNKLEIRNISKKYEEGEVLEKITFDVIDGEFLSILGSSGCGKTTLLKIVLGLLQPDEGSIFKCGKDITNYPPDKRNIGIVFQNYALFENMTVEQNIEYALRFHKETKYKVHEISEKIINTVGLQEFRDKMPANLSGGQQQRVAIARTLALNPDVILFDEPMSALDASTRVSMRKELKSLQKEFGTTMIYVTHDQEEAFSMSDRILIMENGRISQIDTPENIANSPANDYVKSFVVDNLRKKIDSLLKFAA